LCEIPGVFLHLLTSLMPGGSKWLQTFWHKEAADDAASVSSETNRRPGPGASGYARNIA
jgi:hypothetical protein